MLRKNIKKKEIPKGQKRSAWDIIKISFRVVSIAFSVLFTLFFIFIFIGFLSFFISPADALKDGNIAVIGVKGLISTGDGDVLSSVGSKSQDIVDLIEKANKENKIKAILLDIDSGGGAPVASFEIADAVKKSNKTVVAVIREVGASGAYWIASAADKIYANKMSITGSIGVRASKIEVAGLMSDFNVTYRRLVSGQFKDAGTPFKEMTIKEQELYQRLLDDLHDIFISSVAENRNLSVEKVRELADGFVFLGINAKKVGLIDEIGGKDAALEFLKEKLDLDSAKPVEFSKPKSLMQMFSGASSAGFYNIGRGMGSVFNTDWKISLT